MLLLWLLYSFPTGPWLRCYRSFITAITFVTIVMAVSFVTIAHQGVEDEIGGGSGINKPNTVASYVLAT